MVTVEVGPKRQKYHVHKALVTRHSDFFEKALTGPWKEADERVVRLPNIHPCGFNIFVGWMYTGTIPENDVNDWLAAGDCQAIPGPRNERTDLLILQTLVVADQLVAPVFQQVVNNGFADWMAPCDYWRFHYKNIIFAYANLPESCPVLRLIVDAHCVGWGLENELADETDLQDELPPKFLFDVMRRMAEFRDSYGFEDDLNPGDYHIHSTEDEQKKCRYCKNK
jgi:hypothetical protein